MVFHRKRKFADIMRAVFHVIWYALYYDESYDQETLRKTLPAENSAVLDYESAKDRINKLKTK